LISWLSGLIGGQALFLLAVAGSDDQAVWQISIPTDMVNIIVQINKITLLLLMVFVTIRCGGRHGQAAQLRGRGMRDRRLAARPAAARNIGVLSVSDCDLRRFAVADPVLSSLH
jgi:hypothetical protein